MNNNNKIIGKFGEETACEYLRKQGFLIISRNFSCAQGEIDVIFKDKYEYVFGEIKTRRNENCGFPAESVSKYKQKRIWNSAKLFLYINGLLNQSIRFDVIEVYLQYGNIKINHIKNVFL